MIEYEKLAHIQGWIEPQVLPILQHINYMQNDISGNIVEIGVHYGKGFIVLASLLKADEVAIAVDIFDDQAQNISHSGWGSLGVFATNVSALIPQAKICIIKENSKNVSTDVLFYNRVGVRLFSIDGGHSYEEVLHDLITANEVVHRDGVFIVDDFQHIGWDGVFEATRDFLEQEYVTPIAMGGNKLFLARNVAIDRYSTIPSLTPEEYFNTVVDTATLNKAEYIINKYPNVALFREQQHIFDRIQNGVTEG